MITLYINCYRIATPIAGLESFIHVSAIVNAKNCCHIVFYAKKQS